MRYHCINLTPKDFSIVKGSISFHDSEVEVLKYDSMKDLDEIIDPNEEIFFLSLTKDDDSYDIITFLKNTGSYSVNVVLKDKVYDQLLLCHQYGVNFIFDRMIRKENIESALIKSSLRNMNNTEAYPVIEVMDLFSAPIKIKTSLDLFERLSSYFLTFSEVSKFGVYSEKEDSYGDIGLIDSFELQSLECVVTRKYIGQEFVLKSGELKTTLAIPVFCTDEERSFILLEIETSKKEFVLNNLLYKYLENILIYRMNKLKEENLKVLATTDEVTGLFNQRKLSEDLEREINKHEVKHDKFSIMFIDVDHFKKVNDNFGHQVGSKLLLEIGKVLKDLLRESDHVYRYGGDEFVVIMPNVAIDIVHKIATRICSKIKTIDFEISGDEVYNLSLSIGIAEYPTDAGSAMEIIKFADDMMYQSKQTGRGKVIHVKEVKNATTSS